MVGPSDAIFFNGPQQACIPGGSTGICRRWFGQCRTADAHHTPVDFSVFDSFHTAEAASNAVYLRDFNLECVPGGSLGLCYQWFGDPATVTTPPRAASCSLFDDGFANMTAATRQLEASAPSHICLADGTTCRKWFGRCTIP
jgi:hypothetical protein